MHHVNVLASEGAAEEPDLDVWELLRKGNVEAAVERVVDGDLEIVVEELAATSAGGSSVILLGEELLVHYDLDALARRRLVLRGGFLDDALGDGHVRLAHTHHNLVLAEPDQALDAQLEHQVLVCRVAGVADLGCKDTTDNLVSNVKLLGSG